MNILIIKLYINLFVETKINMFTHKTKPLFSIIKRYASDIPKVSAGTFGFSSIINRIINFLPQGNRYIVETLGKFDHIAEPGFKFLIPFFQRIAYQIDIKVS